jgi:hypothetical protein
LLICSRRRSYIRSENPGVSRSLYEQAQGSFNKAKEAAIKNSSLEAKMVRLKDRVGLHMSHFTRVREITRGTPTVTRDQLAKWVAELATFNLWPEASELCQRWLTNNGSGTVPVVASQDGGEDEHARRLYELMKQIVAVRSTPPPPPVNNPNEWGS